MKLNSHIRILLESSEEEGRHDKMGLLSDHLREEDDQEVVEAATPKLRLSLHSLPKKPPELPGMLTPPIQTPASVPFRWEEAPGRPRPFCTGDSKPPIARCLELPPRLLKEAKVTSIPSPTTVLDGPYVGRSASNTWSHGIGGSFRSPDDGIKISEVKMDKVLFFGSNRWAPLKEKCEAPNGENDPFSFVEDGGSGGIFTCSTRLGEPKVKITRVKRRGSLFNLSHSKSHLWASIYESIKQAVPWRRRQRKTGDDDLERLS
ncbi:hypothetical protein SAY87_027180 [Trapa incisa]|uniref:Uncharacterized protein n=1 Tax=Trapa incisa TaxID=236973 RepID=A0AAN7GRE0_9MYRT|nr:hypothetical protein SAY87_027180 [Trapa incisa]